MINGGGAGKEGGKKKKKKKENFTEMQKPSADAEVYKNNKKCDLGRGGEMFKNLIGFLSDNKINSYNGGVGVWKGRTIGKKKKKPPKESTDQVKR